MRFASALRSSLAAAIIALGATPGNGDEPISVLLAPHPAAPAVAVAESSSWSWTDQQVAKWAYDHSPSARLLEAERAAVGKQLDCDDEEKRAMVGLIQAVSHELALHQRNEAAADALLAYYRIVSTKHQLEPLRESAPLLEALESLAQTAERLELEDGDPDLLADRRLQMEDKWFEVDFGIQRLQAQLGMLIGETSNAPREVHLISPLPTTSPWELDVEQLTNVAHHHRRDLAAIRALCRCLNEKSLPAARELMGSLVPGLGLDILGAPKGKLLGLCKGDDAEDLACRKMQCQQMVKGREEQIAAQVEDAVLRLRTALARVDVAERRYRAQSAVAERKQSAMEFEQVPPGTGQAATLERYQRQSEWLLSQLEVAESVVALRRAVGIVLQSQSN